MAVREANRRHEDAHRGDPEGRVGQSDLLERSSRSSGRTTEASCAGAPSSRLGADRAHEGGDQFPERVACCGATANPSCPRRELICRARHRDRRGRSARRRIRYGQRATVIVLPAAEVFLTPRGLEHVGPRAFGYTSISNRCSAHETHRNRRGGTNTDVVLVADGKVAARSEGSDDERRHRRIVAATEALAARWISARGSTR